MGIRWSGYWVGLGVLASTCVGALAAALGSWYRRELLEQGIRLVADKHYGSAVRVLRRAEALTPGDARAHYYLSLAYAGIGAGPSRRGDAAGGRRPALSGGSRQVPLWRRVADHQRLGKGSARPPDASDASARAAGDRQGNGARVPRRIPTGCWGRDGSADARRTLKPVGTPAWSLDEMNSRGKRKHWHHSIRLIADLSQARRPVALCNDG